MFFSSLWEVLLGSKFRSHWQAVACGHARKWSVRSRSRTDVHYEATHHRHRYNFVQSGQFFSEDLCEILLDLWYLGNGCDLVCLGEQPLHVVPLFQFKSSSSESHSRDYFHIPHWINHRLFQEKSRRLQFIKQLLLLKFSFQLLHVCKPGASHAQPRVYTLHSSPRNYLERVVRNKWNETVKWTDLFCFYVSYSHSAYMFSRLQACLLPSLRTWRATMFRSRITTSLTRKCLRPLTAWPPTKLSTGSALQQALLIAS